MFVVVATLGLRAPVAVYFLLARPGDERSSTGSRAWMAGHNAAIMAVLCLVLGAKLIGDAIPGRSS